MRHPTQFQLPATFPLDRDEIERRKWSQVLGSPALILAAGGAATVDWVSKLRLPVISAACTRLGRKLSIYWRTKEAELTAEIIQQMIRRSNRAQDEELARIMRALRSDGYYQYAICLGQFLLLKQRIEGELHAEGTVSRKNEEIETLVDSLCAAVCDQMTRLVTADGQLADALTSKDNNQLESLAAAEHEAHERIRHAYTTLMETTERLDAILTPGQSISDLRQEEMHQLDRLIEQLREENEVAIIVDRELRQIDESVRKRI